MSNNDKKIKRVPYATKAETILYVVFACLFIIAVAVLGYATEIDILVWATAAVLLYLVIVSVIGFARKKTSSYVPSKTIYQMLEETAGKVIKDTQMPTLAINSYGTILWYNEALAEKLTPDENFVGRNASEILNTNISERVQAEKVTRVSIGDSVYNLVGFVIIEEGDGTYLAVLNDITELSDIRRKYIEEKVLPQYDKNEQAHGLEHINHVIRRSFELIETR